MNLGSRWQITYSRWRTSASLACVPLFTIVYFTVEILYIYIELEGNSATIVSPCYEISLETRREVINHTRSRHKRLLECELNPINKIKEAGARKSYLAYNTQVRGL